MATSDEFLESYECFDDGASTSSKKRTRSEWSAPRRPGRSRAIEVPIEPEEATPNDPKGKGLPAEFALDWTGEDLKLSPETHLSYRVKRGMGIGNMRTFSGYTSVLHAYETVLSNDVKKIISETAFGSLVEHWLEAHKHQPRAFLDMTRAFLDRFWDTTTTFCFEDFEGGITYTDFAAMSGLVFGEKEIMWSDAPHSVKSTWFEEMVGAGISFQLVGKNETNRAGVVSMVCVGNYYRARVMSREKVLAEEEDKKKWIGRMNELVSDVDREPIQEARLWLWWFLGSTYFGDKGERVSTAVLKCLQDPKQIGDWDWVSPALGLMIRRLRGAVRPEVMSGASKISLVGPGLIFESWCLAHFPLLIHKKAMSKKPSYPAFASWCADDRKGWGLSYDKVRTILNGVTSTDFVAKPWGENFLPPLVRERAAKKDVLRLYISTTLGHWWYLGERMARQTAYDQFMVPVNPPSCLFVQLDNPLESLLFHETSDTLKLTVPDADYTEFVRTRLAGGPLELPDPDLLIEPPVFPSTVEYLTPDGTRATLPLPDPSVTIQDRGLADWPAGVIKVSVEVHKRLWGSANMWRETAALERARVRELEAELASLRGGS